MIAFEDEAPAGCRTLAELRSAAPGDTDRRLLDDIAHGIGTGDLSAAPSLKIRRNQVATRYADLVDTLYGRS
ncbi:hypothetical protein AB0K09_16270 [Streptomyces sp. NPDC049577]|uniref:hypothetical protein n=1 Tax=Streptomyces sp. NPDC049577 TaxID=3155153 RepID=UPI003425F8F6